MLRMQWPRTSRDECPNNLRGKGKEIATTLGDSDSSNSNMEGKRDSEGNYRVFMTIASIDSKNDLSNLVDELGDLFKDEEIEESEDEDVCQNEGEINLQEAYDSLLEDCGKYAKVANLAVKKMKKVEESIGVFLCNTRKQSVKWKDSRESWLKLTLRSRNLTMYFPLKNLHMIRPVWVISEKEVQAANPRRK